MNDLQLSTIHEDVRGGIFQLLLPDNREVMLLFCKAGYWRGGHSHDCDEMVIMLSGKMRYHKWVAGAHEISELNGGEVSYNPTGIPHMGEFLEDSWVLDWKLGGVQSGNFVTTDFEPFRKLVRESISGKMP